MNKQFSNNFYILLIAVLVLAGASCNIKVSNKGSGGLYFSADQGNNWQLRSYVGQQKNKEVTLLGNSIKQIVF
ncbi:MAG: hypothetical protein ACOZAJ_02045, partial [Patescibacteria group bacterium]